jgi:hypothetical protein
MIKLLLLNRYSFTFGATLILVLIWNLFIVYNDDGIISGRVVNIDGEPVQGARVTLYEKTLIVADPKMNMNTDGKGAFKFTGHTFYRIWLKAEKEGVGVFPITEYRLYFRKQNKKFKEPFRLLGE